MGVKKLLEKQDAGFISLHDLLLKMTEAGDGCTLQEAAIALSRLLWEADQYESPSWLRKDLTRGIFETSSNSPMPRLNFVAEHGYFEQDDSDISF